MYTWIHLGTKNCSAFEPVLWSFHIAQHVRDTSAWKDGVAMVNGGCHPGNTPFNTIKKGIKKSNKGWIASRTRNTSMTWRKSFISSERTWKSCVLNVENVVWMCMEAHNPSTCESVDDYVCNHLQNWDVDGFPGCGSFCKKKQGSRTNASKFTSRTNKKLQIFRVAFSRLGFYSPLCTWLNLGKLGWLQKTPKTITWWPWRNLTIAAPRGSVARSKMVLAAVTWRSPMIFIDSYLSWTSQGGDEKICQENGASFRNMWNEADSTQKRCGNVGELATQRCLIELANLSGQKANYMENMGQE